MDDTLEAGACLPVLEVRVRVSKSSRVVESTGAHS